MNDTSVISEITEGGPFWENHKALSRLLLEFGKLPTQTYVTSMYQEIPLTIRPERQQELALVYQNLVFKTLGIHLDGVKSDLIQAGITSTADHHGVLTHPFSLSAMTARALAQMNQSRSILTTLSCAGISLSNSSFPRGYTVTDATGTVHRLAFKSLHHKNTPAYVTPAITKIEWKKLLDQVYMIPLESTHKKKIVSFLKTLLGNEHLFSLPDFDSQASFIDYHFFKQLSGFQDIDLVYISQESLVRELLLAYHIEDQTDLPASLIHQLVFDPKLHKLFQTHFDGITGAHDSLHKRGTEFFWGIRDGKRIRLYLTDDALVDQEGTSFVLLTIPAITEALKTKQIMPSMALCFIVLSFYYGITCGGGYSQVDYLGLLKNAWMKLLSEIGESSEIDQVHMIKTDLYFGDFAFLKNRDGALLHGLDLFSITSEEEFQNLANTTTLFQSFKNLEGEFLRIGK